MTAQETVRVDEVTTIPQERTATTAVTTEQTQYWTSTSTFDPPTTKATITNVIVEQETVKVEEVTTIPQERTATTAATTKQTQFTTSTSTFDPPTTKATITNLITEQSTVPVLEVTTVPQERTATTQATTKVEVVETIKSTVEAPAPTTADPTSLVTQTRQTTQVEVTTEAAAPISPSQTSATSVEAPAATFTGAANRNQAGFVALAGALAGFVALV